jgi:hypothetical protein
MPGSKGTKIDLKFSKISLVQKPSSQASSQPVPAVLVSFLSSGFFKESTKAFL